MFTANLHHSFAVTLFLLHLILEGPVVLECSRLSSLHVGEWPSFRIDKKPVGADLMWQEATALGEGEGRPL
jgi:hypothetical protein